MIRGSRSSAGIHNHRKAARISPQRHVVRIDTHKLEHRCPAAINDFSSTAASDDPPMAIAVKRHQIRESPESHRGLQIGRLLTGERISEVNRRGRRNPTSLRGIECAQEASLGFKSVRHRPAPYRRKHFGGQPARPSKSHQLTGDRACASNLFGAQKREISPPPPPPPPRA